MEFDLIWLSLGIAAAGYFIGNRNQFHNYLIKQFGTTY